MWADPKKNSRQFIINPKDPVHKLDLEGINNSINDAEPNKNNYLSL